MAAKQNTISLETGLLIAGAIILFPVIKGLFNVANAAGDILSLPGNLVKKIGDSAAQQVHDAAYLAVGNYVSYHIYNPNDPKDVLDMKRLNEDFNFTNAEKATLISEWKNVSASKLGRIAGGMAQYQLVKNQLVGFLRNLLP